MTPEFNAPMYELASVALDSSVEPSGNVGSPWNKGYAKSAVDGLVEGAALPMCAPILPGANTPSGRKIA